MTIGRSLALGAASGLLLALSMPPSPIGAFAWVSLMPLLWAIEQSPGTRRAGLVGFTTGVVFFTAVLHWTTLVVVTYGRLSMWVAVAVTGALVLYLSIFPAVFALILFHVRRRAPVAWPAAAPVVWVATEYLRGTLLTGFPWCLLGYSQHKFLAAAQPASIGGVYMVSALVVLGSSSAFWVRCRRYRAAAVSAAIVGGTLLFGAILLWRAPGSGAAALRVGIVQPATGVVLDSRAAIEEALEKHVSLTLRLEGVDLVVWPENSLVRDLAGMEFFRSAIGGTAAKVGAPILVNSIEYDGDRVTNSSILVSPGGGMSPRYDKIHLVPFGEYVPMKRWLFFAGKFLGEVSDFTPGERRVLFDVRGTRFGCAICYEIIYPGEVSEFVREGAEFLVTQSNDTWYQDTIMPYQHEAMAVFRAIENRRYLVRATNSGISILVDPAGHVMGSLGMRESAALAGEVHPSRALTLYTRSHDAFAIACLLASLVLLLATIRRRGSVDLPASVL